MTAKRQSLIKKGVLKKDYAEASRLTDPSNINQSKLESFAIESAKYATDGKMPHFTFSQNHQVCNRMLEGCLDYLVVISFVGTMECTTMY